ncbi:hypothetical protein SAMN04489761_0376 [Tenacibaculum sp. MAR_2009_124]|uniref:DUF6503 family protein n=1 Tax=Tenacibaculum sp. MAR_2009_124 TaxID=1250059 RepID=UPI00089D8E46|nr:DUF6503 family protein [Tenacibaculum sp. MAR_2009_124]SEB38983.1 hypothetical protein SAMN04489761_0376 [Tenacibaculum sp. MAR_2009_124]
MKKLALLLLLVPVFIGCNSNAKSNAKKEKEVVTTAKKYPEAIVNVFKKHGGIEKWNTMKTLTFSLKGEKHITDLPSRKALVKSEKYALGFNGKDVWLQRQDTTAFKGNPEFYYNLYFYFYAMPFVLADDGIVYSETAPLVFEGVSYPGIKISYGADVGISPDDNYFIYYNPDTYQMEWLGYTVTYFSKKATNKTNIIKYDDWENVNGLLLPKSLIWYTKDEDGKPLKPRGEATVFSSVEINETSLPDNIFEKSNY